MEKISVNHSCGDSGLKCVDCAGQVCPKCFVQCAVGNRCKKCASRFTSHVLKVSPAVLIRLTVTMLVLGFGYGYLAPHLLYMPFGFYGSVVEFFIFFALGKFLHGVASYKLGWKLLACALIGLAVGLALGPFREIILTAMAAQNATGSEGSEGSEGGGNNYTLSQHLVNLAIMAFGVLAPYFRKG